MAVPSSRSINYDNVNTFAQTRALPKMTDTIFRSNPLIRKLYDAGTKLDGGSMIEQGLIYGEGPGGAFDDGNLLDTSESEIATSAFYAWKHYYASATIRRMDELKTMGSQQRFGSLLTTKLKVMEKSMKNHLGNGVHGSGAADPLVITGLIDQIATSGVVGNISKATNTWWQSTVTSMTGTPLSEGAMRSMCGSLTEDEDKPNLIVTTQAIYDIIFLMLDAKKRIVNQDVAEGGFVNLRWEGLDIVVDSHCPSGVMYFLNTNYLDLVTHSDENMRLEPFEKPFGRTSRSAFLFWAGNLTCSNARFQGKMTSVTS